MKVKKEKANVLPSLELYCFFCYCCCCLWYLLVDMLIGKAELCNLWIVMQVKI